MIDGLSVLALVPARGGSKGIPGKNIVSLGGRPMIAWTIEAARDSRYVDRVVLSSDDATIMKVAADYGCEVPFERPDRLATDEASTMDVVFDALDRLPAYDLVVLLQPTSPLREGADIDASLERLLASGAPSCVSLRRAREHPYLTYRLADDGAMVAYAQPSQDQSLRRQDLPAAWCLNGAVYAAHTDWLRKHRSFVSPETVGYPMPESRSIDIDTPADLNAAESAILARDRQER
ncbi:acylneuraminate cytidylyltransferase family protein [Pelomonas sp. P7]|uniref:Acylneuraminate cytidylyltransferase family protein n=1 Tax=Pelomonas caseinilytica TaxID=2906763 RepID=A0ABS8XEN2_9BURK|nr:acylneuraminate cytidylyltransferase family protein [Pelomonas sp. P7]MCE4538175.1 acylneuraminate cytidylyltransferase family protein [Pelomonas sp. P7]